MADAYHRASYRNVRPLVLEAAGYRCQMTPGCLNPATTVDHVIPLSAGGTNHPSNLRAACRGCNSRGGMKIVNELGRARRLGARSRTW
jgi:5-methylcytosine-specific restriction endonuclease McrA